MPQKNRPAGRIDESQSDLLGRAIKAIQNYDDGTPTGAETAQDVTTAYEYDSAGRMAALVAYNAKGTGTPEEQRTTYLYESQIDASWQTNAIYPDSTDAPLDWQDVTDLTQSGGVAEATVAGHGYAVGDWVSIQGAAEAEYNGWVEILSVPDGDTFTYSVASTAATPAPDALS